MRERLSTPEPEGRDRTDYTQRHFVNLAAAAFLLIVALALVWTVRAFDAHEAMQRCVDAGRRDCAPIDAPAPVAVRALTR